MVPDESNALTGSSSDPKAQSPRRSRGGSRRGRGRRGGGRRPQNAQAAEPPDDRGAVEEKAHPVQPLAEPTSDKVEKPVELEAEDIAEAQESPEPVEEVEAKSHLAEEEGERQYRPPQPRPAPKAVPQRQPSIPPRPPQQAVSPTQRGSGEPAPSGIAQAIEQVNQIVQDLKDALDDMDEVLESLELAERQKTADEHEIESLRRALRGLQRPREQGKGHRPHG